MIKQDSARLIGCAAAAILFLAGTATVAQDATATAPAAPAETFGEQVNVTAVSVLVEVRDADGNVPADLTVDDFEVREDGQPQTVIALESASQGVAPAAGAAPPPAAGATAPGGVRPLSEPWEIVVWVDRSLSGRQAFKRAAPALASQAEELTRLGSVRVVAAESSVEEIVPATRDAARLRAALEKEEKKLKGREEITALRRQFLREIEDADTSLSRQLSSFTTSSGPSPGTPGGGGGAGGQVGGEDRQTKNLRTEDVDARKRMLIRAGVQQEAQLLRRQAGQLLDWAAASSGRGPRALILLSDGFDLDPRDFYLASAPSRIEGELKAELQDFLNGPLRQEMTRRLAAQGWTLMPMAVGGGASAFTGTADTSGAGRRTSSVEGLQGNYSKSPFLLAHGLEPLLSMASETGGELLTDETALDGTVARLAERVRVIYQAERAPDGKVHDLEVSSKRPGLKVRATRWVASETLDEIAAERARRLATADLESLAGDRSVVGELPIQAVILDEGAADRDGRTGTVAVRVLLQDLGELRSHLDSSSIRVTVGLFFAGRPPFLHHQVKPWQDLTGQAKWDYAVPLRFPEDTARAVVVVEELTTGLWGATIAPIRPRS